MYAIKKAKELGVQTILNPAPAADIDKSIFPLLIILRLMRLKQVFMSSILLKHLMMQVRQQKH